LHPAPATFGRTATGNGLAQATRGCQAIGSRVHGQPRSGWKVTGCDDRAAGFGWPVTGSKKPQAIDKIDFIIKGIDLLNVAVKAFLPSTCIDPMRHTTI
jgi:hypothetical protein